MQRLPRRAASRRDVGFRCRQQFGEALPGPGHGREHGQAQPLGKAVQIDGHPLPRGLVHHVQGQYHRNAQLKELNGQVEVALQRARVEHVDDHVRPFPC